MSLLGIVLGLGLLMLFAFKGKSLIWAAPVCAAVVALFGGLNPLPAYAETYMQGFVGFTQRWFPVFMLGAIFGKILEISGGAQSVTKFIVQKLGKEKAILVSIIAAAVLTYGGVSGFVVIFSMYPIVIGLFREANISRSLIPATIYTGAFTFTMVATPGTPAIQNLIPMEVFGTTATAAPIIGTVSTLIMFGLSYLWLSHRANQFRSLGDQFTEPQKKVFELPDEELPNPLFSIISFLAIVIVLNVLGQHIIVALIVGIILAASLNAKYIKKDIGQVFNEGAQGAVLSVINTSAVVGFGTVVQASPGFAILTDAVMGIGGNPLIALTVAVNLLAGVTGSASGGLTIALNALGDRFVEMSLASGMSLAVFHRIASISAGGLNTMPHDGGVVTYLSHCEISHKKGYFDIFIIGGVIPVITNVIAIIMGTVGIV